MFSPQSGLSEGGDARLPGQVCGFKGARQLAVGGSLQACKAPPPARPLQGTKQQEDDLAKTERGLGSAVAWGSGKCCGTC